MYLLDLFRGRVEDGWCDLVRVFLFMCVCEVSLDDWVNGGSVDEFFINGEDGFSSMGI